MLSPPDIPPKILNSAGEICRAFQIGRTRLKWWRKQPRFPVREICGRLTGHYDDIERFMQNFLENSNGEGGNK